ncbi:MAG: amidohydrolase [Proteobacteria bacterium]|nr:amidohydrolase [Pseudomonadota bacterium]
MLDIRVCRGALRRAVVCGLIFLQAPLGVTVSGTVYPSTYEAAPSPPTLIRNAVILTGTGTRIDNGDVLIENGLIEAVGHDLQPPPNARIIDATGRWVTPGLIDPHSHMGVYSSPSVPANADGNETTSPVTPNVWVEHSVWPQDPEFQTALEGGVTTLQILPGSTNLIGGRSVVLKNVPALTYQAMKFPGAPYGMKMACGENPKTNYGDKGQAPASRMGNVAGYRQAFLDAQEYQRQWDKYERDLAAYEKKRSGAAAPPDPPRRDLKNDTLVGVLKGEIRVHVHCYRADDMATMLDLADEFGFKIAAFHHGVEAYKIADRLAQKGVCGALWADWWGFKMEAYDGIQENVALVDRPANGCAMLHSDSAQVVQRLNQEAAIAMSRGVRMGLKIPPERAIRWITANPAKSLGIEARVGTLEAGKMADVVIWNRDLFSVYALADQVFIDGVLLFDRSHPPERPRSDFMLGQSTEVPSP